MIVLTNPAAKASGQCVVETVTEMDGGNGHGHVDVDDADDDAL